MDRFGTARWSLLFCLLLSFTVIGAAAADIVYPGYPLGTDPFFTPDTLFPGTSLSGNTVTVNGGNIAGNVEGGVSGGADDVANNLVTINSANAVGSTVYGARTRTGNAVGNRVVVSDAQYVGGEVIGGATQAGIGGTGSARANLVEIRGGYVNRPVLGGFVFGSGEAVGNQVTISGGDVMQVWGGNSTFGNSRDNRVVVSGGAVRGDVFGGGTGFGLAFGDAIGNIVAVTGGIVGGSVHGGYTTGNDANGNTIAASGGGIAGSIYGGYAFNGNASGNSVYLSGASVGGDVVGGHADGSGHATGNYVELSWSASFSGGLFGGQNFGVGDAISGNTLYLNGFGGTVRTIQNFEHYRFYLPNTLGGGQTLVSVTGGPVDMNGRTVELTGIEGGGTMLRGGDVLTLFSSASGTPATSEQLQVPKGIALLYDFDIAASGGSLLATVRDASINPSANVLPDGPRAGIAVVTHYAELIDGLAATRILQPAERRRGPSVYVVATGGRLRYDSGSDLTAKGGHLLAGVDWLWKGATVGAFVETGHGTYDTDHRFDSLASIHGGGDVDYVGGGLLAFVPLPGNFYAESSLRAGWLDSDYSSTPVHFRNLGVQYDLSHPYFGLHAGVGQLYRPTEKLLLDMYAKYLWTRQSGDSVDVFGDAVDFSHASSHRLRAGLRLSREVGRGFSPFVGAAYEYEFDAKVTATVAGPVAAVALAAPSVRGGNGIGEIGCVYDTGRGLTVELGVKGYVGKREGALGRLLVGYAF